MKLDRTLIDREGVPDPEDIKAYHEKNDITVAGALYDPDGQIDRSRGHRRCDPVFGKRAVKNDHGSGDQGFRR